jgi:FkbM family methyltransferase
VLSDRVIRVLQAHDLLPFLRLVAVGAADTGQEPEWGRLVDNGLAEVVAFEPDEAACARLAASHPRGWTIVPAALGAGGPATLYRCRSPFCSSLLRPDMATARLFTGLAEYMAPIGTAEVRTRRLDDVVEAQGAAWLSLDVQGAELLILEHGRTVLAGAQVVELEVQLVPHYHGAPGLAEVDGFLRAQGFSLHTMRPPQGRAFAPIVVDGDPHRPVRQILWTDLVYVRDIRHLDRLDSPGLLQLAVLADAVLGSIDLAHLALRTFDRRHGTALTPALERAWLEPQHALAADRGLAAEAVAGEG